MTASKLSYFPGYRKLFVSSFFINPQSNPPGSDKPEPSPNGCTCIRCRLTALHGRLIALCGSTDGPVSEQIGEIAVDLSEILSKGEISCIQ